MATQKSAKSDESKCDCACCGNKSHCSNGGAGCAVYGIGIFGAAFYLFPQAIGFTGYLLAIGKSLVWPALLVYHAFKLLHL